MATIMRTVRCCAIASLFWAGGTAAAEAQCSFTLTPVTFTVGSTATSRTLSIITGTQCSWTAISSVPWITVTDGTNGKGIGSVTVSIAANPGAARAGVLTVGGQAVTIAQHGSGDNAVPPAPSNLHFVK